jgi:hypothetical protein
VKEAKSLSKKAFGSISNYSTSGSSRCNNTEPALALSDKEDMKGSELISVASPLLKNPFEIRSLSNLHILLESQAHSSCPILGEGNKSARTPLNRQPLPALGPSPFDN